MSRQATAEAGTDRLSRKTMKQWNRRGQRANDSVLGRLPACSLSCHASMKSLQVDIAQFIVQRLLDEVKQCPDICFLIVCQVDQLESTMSQVSGSMRCKRETVDHSCAVGHVAMEVVMESDLTCSQGQHSRRFQDQHLKSRVRRECERVTTTGPLQTT